MSSDAARGLGCAADTVVLPALLASRLMCWPSVLGVAIIGYPDKLDPPNRVSSYEWVNLPVRWTPAGTCDRAQRYD